MATLTREEAPLSQSRTMANGTSELDTNVPAPFPKDLVQKLKDESVAEDGETEAKILETPDKSSRTSTRQAPRALQVEITENREVGPSMTHVQHSCLMTLNNLLSQDAHMWQPIVPTRRHSLPAQSPATAAVNFQTLLTTPTSSSALQILVSNLRYRDDPEMREVATDNDTSLLRELDARVTALVDSGLIEPRDARLAKSLVSLLTHINRLSVICPESALRSPVDVPQPPSAIDIYDTLSWQVSELQSRRDAHANFEQGSTSRQAPVRVVEHALLWTQIDDDLDEVFRLCRERTEPVTQSFGPGAPLLPPEYDLADSELPSYNPAEYSETAAAKVNHKSQEATSLNTLSHSQNVDEKMRLDLEAVTMAIDRLYLVAPQLTNQRVELKRSKLEQMEQARTSGSNSGAASSRSITIRRTDKGKEVMGNGKERGAAVTSGKMKEKDVRELDEMLELIGKASSRRIQGQSVVLDGERGMAERVEKARLLDLEKRAAFHERLITHSNSRRLTSQDAVLNVSSSTSSLGTRTKNPDALLTLPEFIREAIPDNVEQARDPEALLSLPEFVRELPPAPSLPETTINAVAASASKFMKKPFRPSRSRSLSAPPLALARLITGSTLNVRTTSPLAEIKADETNRSNEQVNGRLTPNRAGLEVQYVAEHQENLHSVSVFLLVNGQQAGVDIEAEVVPSGGERLIVKCGASTSAPLGLPARVLPGKKDVKVQSGHLEVKLDCSAQELHTRLPSYDSVPPGTGLLDATQLKALNPTSFICASCSLPTVQSSRLSRYDDLPSEHWAELLEAWMCHPDQKLSDRIVQDADGLFPAEGQALVGGSYILFDSSSIMTNNIRPSDASTAKGPDDWQPVRCICGAVTGRCRRRTSSGTSRTTYRLAKYAIRPVSPSSDPLKIPLSAFILEDMDQLVHAHATYRFVILDEEDEKPRILLWMFKPHMRISYATSNHYFLARTASIHAAKVHFKILGPSVSPTVKSTTEKYPGFAQSEQLLYPIDVCRRLAGLLKESNTAYPQGRRVMGGLDVGWLLRV